MKQARPRKRKRWLTALACALTAMLLAECGARLFWKARGVDFFTAHREVYRSFYPTVDKLLRTPPRSDGECFDILLLGGSALHLDYGNMEHILRERLIRKTHKCVTVHNLAAPAQTTLDSFYKYRHLASRHFDLVIVYHGINETRANNCDAKTFASDYSHYAWYKLINDFERRAFERWLIAPFTIEFVLVKAAERLGLGNTLPPHRPDAASLAHGCEIKTAGSVRQNLAGIVEIARLRHEPVLLMTFAYHVPPDYTETALKNRSLDYTSHTYPIELWGRPECVVAGLEAHNEVTKAVARLSPRVIFVDQASLIPGNGQHFNDICHLTHEGCEAWVENILPAIIARMGGAD